MEILVALCQWLWDYAQHEYRLHPGHIWIEVMLIIFVIYVWRQPIRKARDPSIRDKPTAEEVEELIREFKSEPFRVPEDSDPGFQPTEIEAYDGPYAHLVAPAKKKAVNLATFDYLSYATDASIIENACDTIVEYGCGSCGPRGFYGSIKPHLDLESDIAKFCGTHSSIIYSFSYATTSTMIPCFAARGDEILCDENVNLVVQQGCSLSRSRVTYFRHNDMAHVEELMKESVARCKKRKTLPRRFVVTEGVFRNTGKLCNIAQLVELKKKYKFRLILDDSLGFAALGKTGHGTPEHFGVSLQEIDIYVGTMSTALGGVGGFCAGSNMVVDHQRLGATGYVFSAALPPYVTSSCSKVLKMIEKDPSRVTKLQNNSAFFRKLFLEGPLPLPSCVELIGGRESLCSPIVHFAHTDKSAVGNEELGRRLRMVADRILDTAGVMVTRHESNHEERRPLRPTLRVVMKSELSEAELEAAAWAISKELKVAFE